MAMTQFAMVEELASLIKDNLSCKHLVLSIEEALVNFLQDDTSLEGIIELQPMGPYQRLLLHRLADIYGFAHESVGEGDDRHLVLERCPDTAIPSILVSDILWQYDDYQSPTPSNDILRRKEVPAVMRTENFPSPTTLEEREAAYQAARERIFSLHESDEKEVTAPKSRTVPVVAQRMIAHALGTKNRRNATEHKVLLDNNIEPTVTNIKDEEHKPSSPLCFKETAKPNYPEKMTCDKPAGKGRRQKDFITGKKICSKAAELSSSKGNSLPSVNNSGLVDAKNLESEQRGAAQRIFAHALGLNSSKVTQASPTKSNQVNRDRSHNT